MYSPLGFLWREMCTKLGEAEGKWHSEIGDDDVSLGF